MTTGTTKQRADGGAVFYDSVLARRLLDYLRPYRFIVGISASLLILNSAVGVVGPYLTLVAVDRYLRPEAVNSSLIAPWLPEAALPGLNVLALAYLALLLVGFIGQAVQTYLMHYAGQQAMRDLRLEILGRIQKFSISFHNRHEVGTLVTRVTHDVAALNDMFTAGVVAVFGDLLILVFIVGAMFVLSPSLTLVMFTVTPLVLVVTVWFRRSARTSYRRSRGAMAALNSYLQEHIQGMTTVQLFARARQSRAGFDAINRDYRDAVTRAVRAHALFFPGIEWLSVLTVAILLLYGGHRIHEGTLTLGVVIASCSTGRASTSRCRVSQENTTSCRRPWRVRKGSSDSSTLPPMRTGKLKRRPLGIRRLRMRSPGRRLNGTAAKVQSRRTICVSSSRTFGSLMTKKTGYCAM